MVSKEVEVAPPAGNVVKKVRRRRRKGPSRAAKKRAARNKGLSSSTPIGGPTLPDKFVSPMKCAVHAFLLRYQSALRKVPTQLPPRVRAGPPSKRFKRVSWRDEECVASTGGGDPAVLAVGPARRQLTYTRDELMRLRNSPLVKIGLEHAFVGCEALALVLKRRSDSPNEEDKGGRGDAPTENHKGVYGRERERRSADPRERVRKEGSPGGGHIVLSPQRRSFVSGCGAPAAAPAHAPPHLARTRPDSPLSAAPAAPHAPHAPPKPDPAAGRRIGSGRIMVRDMPNSGWEEGERERDQFPSRAEPYRPPREREARANGGDRYDRRSFNRDSYSSDIKRERDDRFNNEKTRDREDNRRSGGRFSQRRFEKEDEPEWFSGGPTSQLETIELRGFDEPAKKNGATNNKETEKWNNSGSRSPATERWRDNASSPHPASDSANSSNDKDSGVECKPEEPQSGTEQPDFNLDEFLKFDAIPDVLTNGSGEAEGGSRFSRWFRRESPTNDARHYERLLHNMVDELDNSTLEQPGPGAEGHVFAPIAPAAPARAPSLLDLLRQANANAEPRPAGMGAAGAGSGAGGKMQSLEELEARLRPQHGHHAPAHHAPPDHDLSAFKRLLAQVSGGHAVPAAADAPRAPAPHHAPPQAQPQPMSLLQMLSKSMEQQKAQQQQQQQQQPHIPQELLYKLLQVQRQQQQQQQAGDLHSADRELLQRPEAQALVHGLKAGEITVQHLMQQLSNPGLQSRHREVLLTILRMQHRQRQIPSPLPAVGVPQPPHLVVPPHHQPLRLSPLPHPGQYEGVPARIPSPRELAAHTQSIMQGALIKKKLEEQRENYRRRHEMQQPKQPTPISFTPTSVLRKMTAEKESDAPSPKQQQWAQPPKMPQGRPIVKGNQSGAAPMGYASQNEYQHYLNQQQQMAGGVRPFPHPQQRQQVPNSYNNMNNMARGMVGGTTLQQLLVQSHQSRLNEMGGGGAGVGGGDNQLARWFSPELLARASAGKLPSVHVPNALSLEDLERHHHSPAPPVRN